MTPDLGEVAVPDWGGASGDVWAKRWQETDAALSGLSAALLAAIRAAAPAAPFKAFEVGCGPGTTTIQVADALPGAAIVACDISPGLAAIARQRLSARPAVRVVVGDAELVARKERAFDLIFSRHGVMFFAEPVRAFRALRDAAAPGASLVFSCFRQWDENPWASELASAAAGRSLAAPGHEAGGFAFADPDYVQGILNAAGWNNAEPQPVDFRYVAGEGSGAVDEALAFFAELGPASRALDAVPEEDRPAAMRRMRDVILQQFEGVSVGFPAAAWIWRATR